MLSPAIFDFGSNNYNVVVARSGGADLVDDRSNEQLEAVILFFTSAFYPGCVIFSSEVLRRRDKEAITPIQCLLLVLGVTREG